MSLPSFTFSFAAASAPVVSTPGRVTPGVDWATVDGDLDMGPNMRLTTGLEAVAQGVQIRLGDILGENFLDESLGVPWIATPASIAAGIEEILGSRPNLPRTRAILRKTILTAPGVARIESLAAAFDGSSRRLSATANIRTTEGLLLTMGGST